MRKLQNNSGLWYYDPKQLNFIEKLETVSGKYKDKHGHVVISAFWRKRNSLWYHFRNVLSVNVIQ